MKVEKIHTPGADLVFLVLGFFGGILLLDLAEAFLLNSFRGAEPNNAGIFMKAARFGALKPRAGIGPAL